MKNLKTLLRERRHKRVRAKVSGTEERPRLSVYKSNKNISAQVIDDEKGVTFFGATSNNMKGSRRENVDELAKIIVESAKEKKIKKMVFDKGGFEYTGIISQFADSVRKLGIEM